MAWSISAQAQAPAPGPSSKLTTDVTASNINVTPRRVVFAGNRRAEAVYVFNRGITTVTVDVKLADNVMLPNGQIAPLDMLRRDDPASIAAATRLKSAGELLLATPSRLILPPGSAKVVRIRAMQPAAGTGEWRSHLTFTAIPPPSAGITADQANRPATNELTFKVRAIFGLSIPLIVRQGGAPGQAALAGLSLDDSAGSGAGLGKVSTLMLTIQRSGDQSVFGDVEVVAIEGRKRETIGFLRGIAVYPEIDTRLARIVLSRRVHAGEKLEVNYTADAAGKREILAQTSLVAP